MRLYWTVWSMLFLGAPLALAQSNPDLLARMKAMEDRIQSLESELAQLKGAPAPVQAAQTPTPTPPPIQSAGVLGGAGAGASKILNPDVSVIGDFLGAAGNPGPVQT